MSWRDANEFVAWLSGLSGKRYRLPSEAEREYAAKEGRSEEVMGGGPRSGGRAAAAGAAPPNGLGLSDLLGNVAEWVADCQAADYRMSPAGASPAESGSCGRRGLRGGSWYDKPQAIRAANRSFEAVSRRAPHIGLRVVRDAP